MSNYVRGGGKLILIGAATVEQTGFVAGRVYEFTAVDGGALCFWGAADATIADGGFDFAVAKNSGQVRATCPNGVTALNVIESDAGSVATAVLLVAEIGNY